MRFFQIISDYLVRRSIFIQTMRELNSYSDRDLNDIGISRCDIPQIAMRAAEVRCPDRGRSAGAVIADANA